jgi:hypothetical protein
MQHLLYSPFEPECHLALHMEVQEFVRYKCFRSRNFRDLHQPRCLPYLYLCFVLAWLRWHAMMGSNCRQIGQYYASRIPCCANALEDARLTRTTYLQFCHGRRNASVHPPTPCSNPHFSWTPSNVAKCQMRILQPGRCKPWWIAKSPPPSLAWRNRSRSEMVSCLAGALIGRALAPGAHLSTSNLCCVDGKGQQGSAIAFIEVCQVCPP